MFALSNFLALTILLYSMRPYLLISGSCQVQRCPGVYSIPAPPADFIISFKSVHEFIIRILYTRLAPSKYVLYPLSLYIISGTGSRHDHRTVRTAQSTPVREEREECVHVFIINALWVTFLGTKTLSNNGSFYYYYTLHGRDRRLHPAVRKMYVLKIRKKKIATIKKYYRVRVGSEESR
jgi:hypothetical protein